MDNKKINLGTVFAILIIVIGLICLIKIFSQNKIQVTTQQNTSNIVNNYIGKNVGEYRILSGNFLITPTKDPYLLNIMKNSKQKLFLEVYNVLDNQYFDAMKAAKARGVDTRLITESNQYDSSGNYYQNVLDKVGGKFVVKNDQGWGTKYVHTKLILNDDTFAIQSANLTYSSFNKNREFIFYSKDKTLYDNLEYIYQSDWNNIPLTPKDINPQLLVCPIDCKPKLENLLKNAKSVLIAHQNFEDKDIETLVEKIPSKEILIADVNNYNKRKTTLGLSLKRLESPYLHGKAILIDEKYLIIGSFNLTKNSLENNREISIILVNPEIISAFKTRFAQDWEKGVYQ